MEMNTDRLALLERRLAAAEGEMARMKRRLRATWTCAFIGAVGAVVLGAKPEARAQFGVTLTSLNNRLMVVENKTQDMSRIVDPNTGQNTVRFSGVNVQVVSGSGNTDGPINGVGNLIVGYNELRGGLGNDRTGSHNLIVGTQNNYSSFGGLVAGRFNTISGQYASVSGGQLNTASGLYASVSGGTTNRAINFAASVSGGVRNRASNFYASVSGGQLNTASGDVASVSGGSNNTASGSFASVSGGFNRSASGQFDWRAGALFQEF